MVDETPPPGEVWVGKQPGRYCYHTRYCGYAKRIDNQGNLQTIRAEVAEAWYDSCSACEDGQQRKPSEKYSNQPEDIIRD